MSNKFSILEILCVKCDKDSEIKDENVGWALNCDKCKKINENQSHKQKEIR